MFHSAAHMTSPFRTPPPRLMHAARLIVKKEYNDFFLFRHPTITFSIENQCMRAQEHQILWSKDVLDGIVLSAVCNLERFRPQLLQKRDNVMVLDKFLSSGSHSWFSLYLLGICN